MNIRKTLHNNKNIINKVLLALLVLISLVSLAVHKGFYFYENHNSIVANLTGNEDKVNEVINKLANNPNTAAIDRVKKLVEFEGVNIDEVRNLISSNIETGAVNVELRHNFYKSSEFLVNLALTIAALIATSLVAFLYFIFRVKQKFNYRQIFLILGTFLLSQALTILILTGLISLLSRFYQVKNIDLISIFIASLWISISFFFAIWELKYEKFDSLNSLYASLDLRSPVFVKLAGVILLIVVLGLGAQFVIPASLIFLGIFLSNLIINNIGNILSTDVKLKPFRIRFIPIFKFKKKKSDNTTDAPTKIVKKTTAKKKKKKNKK